MQILRSDWVTFKSFYQAAFQLKIFFFLVSFNAYASPEQQENKNQQHRIINQFYALDKTELDYNEVLNQLSCEKSALDELDLVEQGRALYLCAEAAYYLADDQVSLAYALHGLALNLDDKWLKLKLLQITMQVYYQQGLFGKMSAASQQLLQLASASNEGDLAFQVLALSYSAIANAEFGDNQRVSEYITDVEQLLLANQFLLAQPELVEAVANTYQHLQHFHTASLLFDKALRLRYSQNNMVNIERSYLAVAQSYLQQQKFDDALTTFEQVKRLGLEKKSALMLAHAHLGEAQVYFARQYFQQALNLALLAEQTYQKHQLKGQQFKTVTLIAVLFQQQANTEQAEFWARKALALAGNVPVNSSHSMLYKLLAEQRVDQARFKQALSYYQRYMTLEQQFHHNNFIKDHASLLTSQLNQNLMLKMSELNEVKANYQKKFATQEQVILALMATAFIFMFTTALFLVKKRRLAISVLNDDKPTNSLKSPTETKHCYQLQYKMARKYHYPLSIAYIAIENWQELSFHFNDKVLKEVANDIAVLLSESIDEFETIGTINGASEFVLLCPHQSISEIKLRILALVNIIEANHFANLGDFSLKVNYRCGEPEAKDIDPYIYLSKLCAKQESEDS